MSEIAHRPITSPARLEGADRMVGGVVYGLYLIAPITLGLTGLIGAVVAERRKHRAGELGASHFRFQVWTFWAAAFAMAVGGLWFALGSAHALAADQGDGAWLAVAGAGLWWATGVTYFGATIYGLSRLVSRSPIGRLFGRGRRT